MGGVQPSTILDGVTLPPNFSWVHEKKVAGCGLPQSNEELIGLTKANVGLLITLTELPVAPGVSNTGVSLPGDLYAKNVLDNLKILHVPTRDGCPPTVEEIHRCVMEMERCIGMGKGCVPHCYAGQGRTGTIIAAYFVKCCGMDADQAIRHIRALRSNSIHTVIQEKAVRSYEQFLKDLKAGKATATPFKSIFD